MPYPRRSPYTPQRDPGRYTSTITDLIQRGGDIQAQNAAIQGDIWGNAIQDVGQIAGQGLSDYFDQRNLEKEKQAQEEADADRDAKIYSMLNTWNGDPMALAQVSIDEFGPEFGLKLTEGVLGAQKMGLEVQEAQQALAQGDEEAAQQNFERARESLRPQYDLITAMGGPTNPVAAQYLADALPVINAVHPAEQDLTIEQLAQPEVWESVGAYLGREKPEPIKLGKGDRLVDPATFEERVGPVEEEEDPLDQRLKELKVAQAEKDLRAGPGGSASFTPKVVTVAGSETPILVNYNSKTGKYHDVDTNEVLTGVGPEIEMDTEAEQTKALGRFMDELKGLSQDLIKDRGLWQRAKASGMSIENFLLTKPDYKIYRDTRKALAAALAKRFDPRPSNFDIEHVWIPMLPDVFTDSPDSREGKWRALNRMAGLAEEEDTSAESQGIPEIPEAALEGLDDTERDIVNSVVRGSR